MWPPPKRRKGESEVLRQGATQQQHLDAGEQLAALLQRGVVATAAAAAARHHDGRRGFLVEVGVRARVEGRRPEVQHQGFILLALRARKVCELSRGARVLNAVAVSAGAVCIGPRAPQWWEQLHRRAAE